MTPHLTGNGGDKGADYQTTSLTPPPHGRGQDRGAGQQVASSTPLLAGGCREKGAVHQITYSTPPPTGNGRDKGSDCQICSSPRDKGFRSNKQQLADQGPGNESQGKSQHCSEQLAVLSNSQHWQLPAKVLANVSCMATAIWPVLGYMHFHSSLSTARGRGTCSPSSVWGLQVYPRMA